ncbi:MAG: VWA domain-containing protein [Chromatiaceae bacterium]
MPPEFHFLRPLWLLMLVPLVWVLWSLARRGGTASAWRGVVDAHLLPHLLVDHGGGVRHTPLILLALGWVLGVLALAGPVWERLPQPVYRTQAQRVIVLDISPTMNATDVPPSRLARARFEVLDLLKRAAEGQTALLAYGAEPFVVSPLTTDTDTIAAQVPSLDTALLPVEGNRRTDLALEKAAELLRQAGSRDGDVILVTDGLDQPAAADEAASKLRAEGYRVSVLGIGTDKGAPVPMADGGFLKDASGAILLPKLERATLEALAAAGGGRFVPASLDDRDVDTLIAHDRARLNEQAERQDLRADEWREEGPWLLLVLLPLAALAFRRGWLSPLVLLVLLAPPPPAHAFGWQGLWLRPDQQAARALAAGKSEQAAAQFQRRDWRAAAHYQAGDYTNALKSLDGVKGSQADYNRGNTLARLGKLEQAVKAYDRALATDPSDADARFNRDLVQKLLDQQKQRQQQQAQSGQPQGQSVNQGKSKSGQKGQGQQRGGQQGQEHGRSGSEEKGNNKTQAGASGQKGAADKQAERQAAQQPKSGDTGRREGQRPQGGAATQGDEQHQQQSAQTAKGKPTDDRAEQDAEAQTGGSDTPRKQGPGAEPSRADLLGGEKRQAQPQQTVDATDPAKREDAQAMEQMLRRVPDDPSGLLRQRFLLQHLRRTGELQ